MNMIKTNVREETADESGVELRRLLAMKWYTLEHPWCHSDYAGTLILAGSNDPHAAVPICETDDLVGDHYDRETAIGLAQHIIDLHNASIMTG